MVAQVEEKFIRIVNFTGTKSVDFSGRLIWEVYYKNSLIEMLTKKIRNKNLNKNSDDKECWIRSWKSQIDSNSKKDEENPTKKKKSNGHL